MSYDMIQVFKEVRDKQESYIESFKDDLHIHDCLSICQLEKGTRFIHIAREFGSYLTVLQDESEFPRAGESVKHLFGYSTRESILEQVSCQIEHAFRENSSKSVLYYNGKELVEISIHEAKSIVEAYKEDMRKEWSK